MLQYTMVHTDHSRAHGVCGAPVSEAHDRMAPLWACSAVARVCVLRVCRGNEPVVAGGTRLCHAVLQRRELLGPDTESRSLTCRVPVQLRPLTARRTPLV